MNELYQARFDRLKEIATSYQMPKNGSVESLRAKLIANLILDEWDLGRSDIKSLKNKDIGAILGIFGIKKSGSIRERRQRLYLHLHEDPKQLTPEKLDSLNKNQLHDLCKILQLPLTGDKQSLLVRVAGVLASQQGSWGKVKKTLRRPKNSKNITTIPSPSEDSTEVSQEVVSNDSMKTSVEEFVSQHPEGWTFEQETELRKDLSSDGYDTTRSDVAQSIDEVLRSKQNIEKKTESPSMIQTPEITTPQVNSLEVEAGLIEINSRMAEIEAAGRDFLMVSSSSDEEDMEAFISKFSDYGFQVNEPAIRNVIRNKMMELDFQTQNEKQLINSMPNSWREREAIREFENARSSLRNQLTNTLALHEGDLVKARVAFEEIGRSMKLDLRIPSISGRLHALFDLHVDINEAEALQDPNVARRNRILRILHHGSIHLSSGERRTIDRLERNIKSFEEVVETILETSEGKFNESQQALIIKFLESRGYEVNTSDLRPRILACAGIIGAELGHLSPSEIPRVAPGVMVSESQVDAIVTELKSLAQAFRPKTETLVDVIDDDEDISDAADRLKSAREKIDHIDDVLARLRG
ncbi:MAG: hypothetical protein HOI28_08260 [Euryarchaeota archaeon]|nr:hypothetical protein [Euryarchaeota archaeon]MBT4925632.1 hypothetical protein [Euryarchaeota archaeon]MBT5736812.1 hypothetical protein [Euryarchaeota archaeon]